MYNMGAYDMFLMLVVIWREHCRGKMAGPIRCWKASLTLANARTLIKGAEHTINGFQVSHFLSLLHYKKLPTRIPFGTGNLILNRTRLI